MLTETKYVFAADVHLSRERGARTEHFLSFLDHLRTERAHLFVLGDLFDYWANNRAVRVDYAPVLNALGAMAADRLMVYFIHGNRDFLLGADFLARHGIVHLGEMCNLDLSGLHLHITHGHTLCAGDLSFLRYKKVAWPLFRRLDRFLPGPVEEGIARLAMRRSRKVVASQPVEALRISDGVVRSLFSGGVDLILCGHVHRAERRDYDGGNTLVVLPAWDDGGGGYAVLEGGEVRIEEFRP